MATGVTVLAGIWLDRYIESKLEAGFKYVLMGACVIVVFGVLEMSVKLLVEHWAWLRQMICGRDFIEGWWLDIVYDLGTKELLFAGVLRVDYEDGELVFSGESYNGSGRHVGSFFTTGTTYENYLLRYTYDIMSTSGPTHREQGFGVNRYIRASRYPISYTGHFFDPTHKAHLYIYGERVTDESKHAILETREGKQAEALAFLHACDEKYLDYRIAPLQGGLDSRSQAGAPAENDVKIPALESPHPTGGQTPQDVSS